MKSKIKFFIVLSLITSCGFFAAKKIPITEESNDKDLMRTFDLDQEEAKLYKVEEESATFLVPKNDELKTNLLTENKKIEPEKNKVNVSNKIIDKKIKTIEIKSPVTPLVVEAPIVKTPDYPELYPDLLKNYDKNSTNVWKKFKPLFFAGEKSVMVISYLGVNAGEITISSKNKVRINNREAYSYQARFKSNELLSYFYWLDDKLETFVDAEKFIPLKYSLIQREKKQNVDDLQLFNYEKLKTFHWYKRVKEGNNKEEKIENFIPKLCQDSFSALQFVRGLPLIKGEKYEFPVVTRGNPWLLKVEVLNHEVLSIDGKNVKAIKLKAETHFPGVLKKSGDILFWYADDLDKRLLKFQAKVKIGSIEGELKEYFPGIKLK